MMKKVIAFIYGIIAYLVFFGTFVWMILFLGDFENIVPSTVNTGAGGSVAKSLLINVGLIGLFGIQHTVMARKAFKQKWSNIVPKPIERSTYVLFSSLAILLLLWFWQPLPLTIWNVEIAWAFLLQS